ncbi:MAG: hypothetical protein WC307_03995 [Candidatus Nanoarchaeia archaeon]|jgi:hypothetical protein
MSFQSIAKKVVLIGFGFVVVFVAGFFFMNNLESMRAGASNINVNISVTGCQSLCQSLLSRGFNFDSCSELLLVQEAVNYTNYCVESNGPCHVTVKNSVACIIQ